MNFLKKLFGQESKNEPTAKQKNTTFAPNMAHNAVTDSYTQLGLTETVSEEEKELVSAITAAIMVGGNPNSQVRVKNVVGINQDKIAAAVIVSAVAAGDYPNSKFKLRSVTEL